jgi:predicted nucleic acid-binding protein
VTVVDASVLVTALVDDDADGDAVRNRLRAAPYLAAPELVDLEVLSVLRRHVASGRLPPRRVDLALDDLQAFPLSRYGHLQLAERIWAMRDAVSPYDASYLALAELLQCPLLTGDTKLAKAARHIHSPAVVEVLETPS